MNDRYENENGSRYSMVLYRKTYQCRDIVVSLHFSHPLLRQNVLVQIRHLIGQHRAIVSPLGLTGLGNFKSTDGLAIAVALGCNLIGLILSNVGSGRGLSISRCVGS